MTLEVIADGSPLHAQLVVTTIVSPLHCDGTPQQGAANVDGVRLLAARRRTRGRILARAKARSEFGNFDGCRFTRGSFPVGERCPRLHEV